MYFAESQSSNVLQLSCTNQNNAAVVEGRVGDTVGMSTRNDGLVNVCKEHSLVVEHFVQKS